MTTPFPRRLQLLAAMNDAYARGDLEEAYRLEDQHLAELTGRGSRSDAKEPEQQKAPAEGQGDQIDWANVGREVKTMLSLNPQAEPEEED